MAALSPVGGSNRTFVWSDSGGTATTLAFTFNKNETSNMVGHPKMGAIELELANKIRNQAYMTFLNTYLVKVNMSVTDVTYEDGSVDTITNIPSTATKFHVLHLDGAIDGSITYTYFRGILSPDTGNHSRASGSLGDTPVKFTGVPAQAVMTLSTTLLNAAASDLIATQATALSFTVGEYGEVGFFTAI